jgi:RHS repeat-associated protein
VERTSISTYDFYTGLTTSSTDVDNNVTTETEFDILGRSLKIKAAVGTAKEIWTQNEYSDLDRRVITRSDLSARGDGKKVSVIHFDQLGRVRLSRTLENSFSEDPYIETDGIKVQTRYDNSNPHTYSLSSNPYRANTSAQAGNETTMGWSRSKVWNSGRRSEIETFSGAPLPAPWGSNANSTGILKTETDANSKTITDQAGKKKRNIFNSLGQVTRVDEPDNAGNLGTVSSPVQATYYSYNTLGNLVEVTQGNQRRYFLHDSIGRLIRIRQPEQQVNSNLALSGIGTSNNQWTNGSIYDDNGNVLITTDAKNDQTFSTYDQLNRTKTRSYSDNTPPVSFTYDDPNVPFSRGQLTKTSNSISISSIKEFDILGRVLKIDQITDGQVYSSNYQYNLSGLLVKETYPTGRIITNTFDNKGDLIKVTGKMGTFNKNYADLISYTPSGHIQKLKIGNGLWEVAKLNSRMQATEIGLGTGSANSNLWKIDLEYGEINSNGSVNNSKNSGNIAKQTISFSGLQEPFVQTYKYDSLDRLSEARETSNNSQTWKQTYGYDRFGNRTHFSQIIGSSYLPINNKTRPTVDPNTNRFLTNQGYTYDFNGNLISDAEGRQFTFNADNKQTQVKDVNNDIVGQYYYDGDGKRIKKVTALETVTYVYSGGKLVAEYSSKPSEPQVSTKYVATDFLGSIRVITDQNGNIVSRRDFMPFGEDLYAGTPYRTSVSGYKVFGDSVRQRFTGYERDEETGLDFAEARYYKNDQGRFTAVDPLLASGISTDPQTFNRYVYVMNNPLYYTDSNGLQAGSKLPIVVPKRIREMGNKKRVSGTIYQGEKARDVTVILPNSFVSLQRKLVNLAYQKQGQIASLNFANSRAGGELNPTTGTISTQSKGSSSETKSTTTSAEASTSVSDPIGSKISVSATESSTTGNEKADGVDLSGPVTNTTGQLKDLINDTNRLIGNFLNKNENKEGVFILKIEESGGIPSKADFSRKQVKLYFENLVTRVRNAATCDYNSEACPRLE